MDFGIFVANVAAAFGLGAIIGFERELRNHEAGLRTNALVALGAGLFVSLARWFHVDSDPTRIAGQVVTGVGFLAGGVIIRDGFNIRGLNTAATLWCTAAIGTLAGSGFPLAAAFGTAIVLFLHIVLRPITSSFDSWVRKHAFSAANYRVKFVVRGRDAAQLRTSAMSIIDQTNGINLFGLRADGNLQTDMVNIVADVTATNDSIVEKLTATLANAPGVSSAGWDRHMT